MHSTVIPFTTHDIYLVVSNNLSSSAWEALSQEANNTVAQILKSLSVTETNSALYRLHNSGLGFPVQVDEHILKAILMGQSLSSMTMGAFTYISPKDAQFDLEQDTGVLTRLTDDAQIKTSRLVNDYTLKTLSSLLSEKVDSFLISAGNTYVCKGPKNWEIKFPHPELDQPVEMVINNTWTCLHIPPTTTSQEAQASPFSNQTNSANNLAGILIEAADILKARAAGYLVQELQAPFQLQSFVNSWHCGLTLLNKDGSFSQFSY